MKFFDELFDKVEGFFGSLHNFYFSFGSVFFFALVIFIIIAIIVIITTSQSYEAKLIKAIDMLNNYFIDNPQINEDNLVNFNNKMKTGSVPKQLRKQWQQYVLYREGKASSYMSYENCVTKPIGNSGYKRDVKTLNITAYIIATLSFLLNCYIAYGDLTNTFTIIHLQEIVITPVVILLLNFILTIFFDSRHNAIVSDLYQNYQYFEVNIDKATQTLPEYVDYEVLFDKNEIKKGIPILYAYLQKRAEEEQKELERARLKNVEHEKFNFDDAGVAGSLVLERAMQEAENYIAERKKFNEDTEQINNDITTENSNYREITKEYNRQMQVSRETFANFKQQLEEVSSSIEANYLKKQQQQELDRQRNLERDFDTATEKHKKVLESYQEELDQVDKERAKSRKTLEDAMMSEFATYSSKIYDEVRSSVNGEDQTKIKDLKGQIKDLEETLSKREEDLEGEEDYDENSSSNTPQTNSSTQPDDEGSNNVDESLSEDYDNDDYDQEDENEESEENDNQDELDENQDELDDNQDETSENQLEDENDNNDNADESQQDNDDSSEDDYDDYDEYQEESNTKEQDDEIDNQAAAEEEPKDNSEDSNEEITNDQTDEDNDYEAQDNQDDQNPVSTEEREGIVNPGVEVQSGEQPRRKAGRPRKIVDEPIIKRSVGRPRKEQSVEEAPKKGRGRPRKNETANVEVTKVGRGRPRKNKIELSPVKKGRGRPRKDKNEMSPVKKGRGRPKKFSVEQSKPIIKKGRGRPRKDGNPSSPKEIKVELKSSGRGRPRKNQISNPKLDDFDSYLKQLDDEIARENLKLEESRKQLVRNSKIKGNK